MHSHGISLGGTNLQRCGKMQPEAAASGSDLYGQWPGRAGGGGCLRRAGAVHIDSAGTGDRPYAHRGRPKGCGAYLAQVFLCSFSEPVLPVDKEVQEVNVSFFS